jgi:CheY-like chemotaxis protein
MLVDADAAARAPIAQRLRAHGMQVIEAGSVAEAFGLALFGRLHFVVTLLHGAHGLELCRRLRSTPATSALPVVLVNDGHAVNDDELHAAGATVVLPAQRSGDDILAAIHRAIT